MPSPLRRLALGLAAAVWLLSVEIGATASASEAPLPELPKAPSLEVPRPSADDLATLDAHLERLTLEDAAERDEAARELLELSPKLVPAIHQRLDSIANRADREAMKRLLGDIRDRARSRERQRMEAAGERGSIKTPDYLSMVIADAGRRTDTWKDLVRVLGMSRALTAMGTVGAVRELVFLYSRYGEFLRVDTQLQLEKLGPKAVAALIEARRHQADKIARWAERQLDALGKAIPSEAVQVEDHQLLADVLRAFGRVRDPDAGRIIISFANSERHQVREAARQALTLLGEVGHWQLRDAYENTTGKKPPRDWTWERTARQLFAEFDRSRQAQVYELFDAGVAKRKAGDLEGMREAFDRVLARSPEFERRAEMAQGYLDYARGVLDETPALAATALRRVARIASDAAQKKQAQSLLLTLEAEALLERGVADQALVRQATELDPNNTRARETLGRLERGETKKEENVGRFAAAGAIGVAALAAILFVILWRRRDPRETERESAVTEPEGDGPAATEQSSAAPETASGVATLTASSLDAEDVALPAERAESDSDPQDRSG